MRHSRRTSLWRGMKATRATLTLLRLFALGAILSGCIHGEMLTPAEVSSHGRAAFNAPRAKVFAAAAGTLRAEGYVIAQADLERGVIRTGRKTVRVVAVGSAHAAQAVDYSRQYTVTLRSEGPLTAVTAEPRVFMGERDVSEEAVWALDGPEGERALWNQFFRELNASL
jgi:hypothetical protein